MRVAERQARAFLDKLEKLVYPMRRGRTVALALSMIPLARGQRFRGTRNATIR